MTNPVQPAKPDKPDRPDNPNHEVLPAVEFQSLPLEFFIAAPLAGAVKAQSIMAAAVRDFVKDFGTQNVEFTAITSVGGQQSSSTIKVPLLSIVPIPNLHIDSLTVDFKYEVSQVVADKSTMQKGLECGAGTTGFLSKFVNATVKGTVASTSSSEATTNRSGSLHITLHASESTMPEGLSRVMSFLSKGIPDGSDTTANSKKKDT